MFVMLYLYVLYGNKTYSLLFIVIVIVNAIVYLCDCAGQYVFYLSIMVIFSH